MFKLYLKVGWFRIEDIQFDGCKLQSLVSNCGFRIFSLDEFCLTGLPILDSESSI